MFGYVRRGGEIRPAVSLCVAPVDPTPSSSHQGGITNGSLHFGHREGVAILTADQREEARADQIRLLVNQTRDHPSKRSVTTQPGIFCASVRVVIQSDRVASVRPLPPPPPPPLTVASRMGTGMTAVTKLMSGRSPRC